MKQIRHINHLFEIFGLITIAALVVPAPCHGQGYTISTFAGGCTVQNSGDGGPAATACFDKPSGMAVDAGGNLFIADEGANTVRKVTPAGNISTVAGNASLSGGYSGDGGPATSARLWGPVGVVVDAAGNLYIADGNNRRIRKVTPDGTISTVAGGGIQNDDTYGDGGPATAAWLYLPWGVAVDAAGNLFIADYGHKLVRKVAPDGLISTYAGGGLLGAVDAEGGPATSAIVWPNSLVVDGAGNLYIADVFSYRIRKVSTRGIISTFAGNGFDKFYGDGGPATSAAIYNPEGAAVDSSGNIYIADTDNYRVRMVTTDGTINTIAGNGRLGSLGDGGPATSAELSAPTGLAVDNRGRVFITDLSSRVRMLTGAISSSAPAIKSGGVVSAGAFGAFTSVAPGSWIEIYGSSLAATTRSWAGTDFNGVSAPTALDGTSVTIGGQRAFIDYISPAQVNAQVPSTVGTGSQLLAVTTAAGASVSSAIAVNLEQPGLLAPATFLVGGKQYAAALFSDGTTYVLPPGAIPGLASRRAKVGDTITIYGVGFGTVTPAIPAGQVVQQSNSLAAPFHLLFGPTEATVSYAGLAPNAVGLYQFNVVVPNVLSSDSVPLTFTLAGNSGKQTLYLAVQ